MGKKYKNRKKYYKKPNYYNKEEGKEAALTIAFILSVFFLLWFIFWLGVIIAVIGIIYFTHKINRIFNLYSTKYYYGVVITFFISAILILFGGTQIAYNIGKINNTFWGWAIESSDYLKLNHSKGKTSIDPNIEGMVQKSVINSITSTGNNIK